MSSTKTLKPTQKVVTLPTMPEQADISIVVEDVNREADAINRLHDRSGILPSGNGTQGQYMMSNGDGTSQWVAPGTPSTAQIDAAVQAWLDAHPNATTTVQDGAITRAKLDNDLQGKTDIVPDLAEAVDHLNIQIVDIHGVILPPAFEIGLRYVSNSAEAWYRNTKRLTFKRGTYLNLKQGDYVTKDISILEYGGGYSVDNGATFVSISSLTGRYTAPADGIYFFWMTKSDNTDFTADEVANGWTYLHFSRDGSMDYSIADLQHQKRMVFEQFPELNGVVLPPEYEIGCRYVNNSGAEVWSTNNKRLTFKRGLYLALKQGDVISRDSTVVNEFAGGYTTNGGQSFTSIETRQSPLTAPADGLYFFWFDKLGQTVCSDADVENAWKYVTIKRAGDIITDVRDLQQDSDTVKGQFLSINGSVVPPPFEIGCRYIAGGVDTWSTNNKRLTFQRWKYISLKQGDVVSIDRTVLNEFAGGYSTDGGSTFTSISSRTTPYTAPVDGLYVFWADKQNSATVTADDVSNAWQYMRFTRSGNMAEVVSQIPDIEEELVNVKEQFPAITGYLLPPLFEIGCRYVSNNTEVWSTNNKRLTFKRGSYITLKEGDVVSKNRTVVNEFAGGYSTDGGSTFTSILSRTDPYTAPADGIYFFWFDKIGQAVCTDEDVENASTYIYFTRSGSLAEQVSNVQPSNDSIIVGSTGFNNTNLLTGEILFIGDNDVRTYATAGDHSVGFVYIILTGLSQGDEIEITYDSITNPLSEYTTGTNTYLALKNSSGTTIGYADLNTRNRYTVGENVATVHLVQEVTYQNLPTGTWVTGTIHNVLATRGEGLHINDKFLNVKTNEKSGETLKPNHTMHTGSRLNRCYNPYENKGQHLLVGQLHCHAKELLNGEMMYYAGSVEETCRVHASLGYHFITITDYMFNGEITTKPSNTHGLIWLCDSQEAAINPANGQSGEHMCIYNSTRLYTSSVIPKGTHPQDVANIIKADNCACDLAHPAWTNLYQEPEKVELIKDKIRFCEVYDGLNDILGQEQYPTGKSTDYAWEIMLDNDCVVWGTAVNDEHARDDGDVGYFSKGCVKVFAHEQTPESIWKALCTGCFYSCSHISATLSAIELNGNTYRVSTNDSSAVTVFMKEGGTVVKTVTGTNATYNITGSEKYVRAVVTLSSGYKIWTQPVVNIRKYDLDDFDFTY